MTVVAAVGAAAVGVGGDGMVVAVVVAGVGQWGHRARWIAVAAGPDVPIKRAHTLTQPGKTQGKNAHD